MRKDSGVDSFHDQIEPLRVEGVKTEEAPREEGVRWQHPPHNSSSLGLYTEAFLDVQLQILIFLNIEATES